MAIEAMNVAVLAISLKVPSFQIQLLKETFSGIRGSVLRNNAASPSSTELAVEAALVPA